MRSMVKTAGFAIAAGFLSGANAEFSAGFGRMDITPPLGTELSGYSQRRISDGVLDPLDAIAIALCHARSSTSLLAVAQNLKK